MAAVAHATIIWPVMGIAAPLVIWATQREKSRFLAFQALQAAVYHMTLVLVGFSCGVCYFCSYVGMIVGSLAMPFSPPLAPPGAGPPAVEVSPQAMILILLGFLCMIVFFGLLFLGLAVWLAYIACGLYAAVANLQGKDFRYAVLGSRLERYLEGTPAKPGASP